VRLRCASNQDPAHLGQGLGYIQATPKEIDASHSKPSDFSEAEASEGQQQHKAGVAPCGIGQPPDLISSEKARIIAHLSREPDMSSRVPSDPAIMQGSVKTDRDMVSNVDLEIAESLHALLTQRSPETGFLGEETGGSTNRTRWVVDPIDGTANFLHGLPLTAIAPALLEDGQPQVAVIDRPFLGVRYNAVKDGGAYRDDTRIHASECTSLDTAMVSIGDYATGANSGERSQARFRITALLAEHAQRVRMLGSAAIDLVWVAEGLLDASIMLSNKPWDTAPGVLIAREAGAIVTGISGAPHTLTAESTIATAPGITHELLAALAQA
jgi:myo-inositol-1(or 4)-monophosphatase